MAYIIGQGLGLAATFCCFIGPFWKKKWQMLVNTAIANVLVALNFLLIGQVGSALVMNLVAIVQSMVSLVHTVKGTRISTAEKVIFLILYIGLGLVGMVTAPDFVPGITLANAIGMMPIIGAVLLMVAVFMRNEQTSRKFGLANALVWMVYDAIIGTTAIFAQIISIVTTSAALYKYRKRNS